MGLGVGLVILSCSFSEALPARERPASSLVMFITSEVISH